MASLARCGLATAWLTLAACSAAQSGEREASASESYPPFALADVGFTADCNPNDAFGRLLTLFSGGRSKPIEEDEAPDFDEPLYNAVSGDISRELMLDDSAGWHGLHLKRIELYHGIERGPANYSLVFDDPPEKVREVWNARGWNLPPVNEDRDIEGLEGYASIMVAAEEGGYASVTCFRD
jgi:hypothetical protein